MSPMTGNPADGYCDYPPAPPPPPGHTPAWKTQPPSRRWDAYRQIAESLPAVAETRGTLAAAIAVAEAGKQPDERAARRWAWLPRRRNR